MAARIEERTTNIISSMADLSEDLKRRIADVLDRDIAAIPDREINPEGWASMLEELREKSPGLYRAIKSQNQQTGKPKRSKVAGAKTGALRRLRGLFFIETPDGERAPNKLGFIALLAVVLVLGVFLMTNTMMAPPPQPKKGKGVEVALGARDDTKPSEVDQVPAAGDDNEAEGAGRGEVEIEPVEVSAPAEIEESSDPVLVVSANDKPPLPKPDGSMDDSSADLYAPPGTEDVNEGRAGGFSGVIYEEEENASGVLVGGAKEKGNSGLAELGGSEDGNMNLMPIIH